MSYQRIRTTSDIPETGTTSIVHTYPLGGVRKPPTSGEVNTLTKDQSMVDIVTGSYKRDSAKGKIINSPMEKYVTVQAQSIAGFSNVLGPLYDLPNNPGYVLAQGFKDNGTMRGGRLLQGIEYPIPPIDLGEAERDLAITQAHANVDVSVTEVLTTIAEARESVNSVVSILKRAQRIFKKLKKLQSLEKEFTSLRKERYRKGIKKSLKNELSPKEVADRYLEIRYALRPIVIDLHNHIKAVNAKKPPVRNTARGQSSAIWQKSETGTIQSFSSFETEYRAQTQVSITHRAGVLFHYDVDDLQDRLNRYGIDKPLETALELVPFSFIAGWFFNISDYLSSWTPNAGTTILSSWIVSEVTTIKSGFVTGLNVIPKYTREEERSRSVTGEGWEVITTINTTRTPNPDIPIYPRLDINLDTFKLIDLALIFGKIAKN